MTAVLFIRASNPAGFLLWCVIGFCVGIVLFFYGFRLLQRRRLILDTPFSKIRSASLGMVEVSGLAVGPYTMIAPITSRPCYYYRTLVWEWKQSGKNKQWVKVAGECLHVPFFVDDNTGRMLVDPRGADLDLHRDFEQEFCDSFFTTKDPAPANVHSFLARHGVVTSNKIKVEEFCIKPENSLFLLGTLAENPGLEVSPTPIREAESITSFTPQGFSLSLNLFSAKDGGFETGSAANQLATNFQPQQIGVVHSTLTPPSDAQQQKIANALLKAGISSPAAWSAAGISAGAATAPAMQVITDPPAPGSGPSSHAAEFDSHPPVVLMKGTNNKTFMISWRSQQEVARSLGWKCALMIWGGPMLALLCLYIFLSIERML
ncbi:MAG: hypothetical protein ABSG34_13615 [Candidatus Sulfotelmatobacter sp.]